MKRKEVFVFGEFFDFKKTGEFYMLVLYRDSGNFQAETYRIHIQRGMMESFDILSQYDWLFYWETISSVDMTDIWFYILCFLCHCHSRYCIYFESISNKNYINTMIIATILLTFIIITSAKEVMSLAALVCLFRFVG